jgi:hypothetical protein
MPLTKVTFDMVREIGLGLPDVEDSTMYGALAFKVRGSLLACKAINKSAEPDSLAVRIDFEQRAALLAEAPRTYYVTDHYVNYPMVLVRLSQVGKDELRDLLNSAWRFVTSRQKGTSRPVARTSTGGTKLKKRRRP